MYLEDGVVFYDRLDSDITSKTPTYTMQGWLRMKECSPRATLLDLSVSKSVLPRLYSQCHPRVANSGKDGSMRGATGVKPVKPSQEETGKKADHVKSIRKTTDVECLEFDFIARSVQGLYHHMKSIHPQAYPYQCNICSQWFGTPYDCHVHENSVHTQKVLTCDLCNFNTYNQFQLTNHQCTHSNHKLQCEHCNVSLSLTSILKEHMARHFDSCTYPCEAYDKTFASVLSRKIHVVGKHGAGFVCPLYQKQLDSTFQLVKYK